MSQLKNAPTSTLGDLFDLKNMLVEQSSFTSAPALSFQEVYAAFYADHNKTSSVLGSLSHGNLALSIPMYTNVDRFFGAPVWIEKEGGERAMAFLIKIDGRDEAISFEIKGEVTPRFNFAEWDKARGYIRTLIQHALEPDMRAAFQRKLLEADSSEPDDQAEDLSLL